MLLKVQRSSDPPFALSFRDGTYDQLLTPAVSDNAYQTPPTALQSTSSFNRCSVPRVRLNNDQNLLRQHQNIFTDIIRNLDVNQVVLTLFQLCDNRVSKCYGCQWPLKNGDGFPFPPPYDVIAVAKMKREYRKDRILCEAPPSNVYFHVFHENPFVSPFSCIQNKLVSFYKDYLKVHWSAFANMPDFQKMHLKSLGLNLI